MIITYQRRQRIPKSHSQHIIIDDTNSIGKMFRLTCQQVYRSSLQRDYSNRIIPDTLPDTLVRHVTRLIIKFKRSPTMQNQTNRCNRMFTLFKGSLKRLRRRFGTHAHANTDAHAH